MKKANKYDIPELEIIEFTVKDILTTSAGYEGIDLEEDDLEGLE